MKTIVILLTLTLLSSSLFSQDTLYMKKGKVILCKVTEIGIDEIKYKDFDNLEGPNYVVHRVDVLKIIYQNGKTEFILPDEMAMNKEEEIIDKNQCLKIAFLSPILDHLELSYERKLKMTKNLEVKVGFIGIGNSNVRYDDQQGCYFQGGVKFLLGQDYYIKGMRYVHPLKGSYLKPELIVSVIDFSYENYIRTTNYPPYYSQKVLIKYRSSLVGFNMIYGKQFILGNLVTFDAHVGVGYGLANTSKKSGSSSIPSSYEPTLNNFGGCVFINNEVPLTLTGGFTLGYIFK